MSEIIIATENLGKRYLISHQGERSEQARYTTLREELMGGVKRAVRGVTQMRTGVTGTSQTEHWAISDLNLAIREGETVGVIGRNGAGKSTLLKLLSRITEPTTGRIWLGGKTASLLEVGTGFHPELTGRENIFLNGVILGMTRKDIQARFDEIVAFAEVEEFLDTPVKRYSSGMYVRLAFAVAAHLEPDILIVDEVLAVGDSAFQKKCLGKMNQVSKTDGRTLLFVSHNMSSIGSLCSRSIVLEKGMLKFDGPSQEAIAYYLNNLNQNIYEASAEKESPHITHVIVDDDELVKGRLRIRVGYKSPFPITPSVGIVVAAMNGGPLFGTNPTVHPDGYEARPVSEGESVMEIENLPLHSGSFRASVWLSDPTRGTFEHRPDAVSFEFVSPKFIPNLPPAEIIGPYQVDARWKMTGE